MVARLIAVAGIHTEFPIVRIIHLHGFFSSSMDQWLSTFIDGFGLFVIFSS